MMTNSDTPTSSVARFLDRAATTIGVVMERSAIAMADDLADAGFSAEEIADAVSDYRRQLIISREGLLRDVVEFIETIAHEERRG